MSKSKRLRATAVVEWEHQGQRKASVLLDWKGFGYCLTVEHADMNLLPRNVYILCSNIVEA